MNAILLLALAATAARAINCTLRWDQTHVVRGASADLQWSVTAGPDEFENSITVTRACAGRGSREVGLDGPESFDNVTDRITCELSARALVDPARDRTNAPHDCKLTAAVLVSNPANTQPGGDVRCYFDRPGASGLSAYAQLSDYEVAVNADICGGLSGSLLGGGYCAGDLGWKTVAGDAWNAPEPAEGYTAHLRGGPFNEEVPLSGGARVPRDELLKNHTYTLTVRRDTDGWSTTCSVAVYGHYPGEPVPGAPQPVVARTGTFPGSGDYSLSSAGGTLPAAYNYAPPMPGVILGAWAWGAARKNFDTFLGASREALYFAVGHWPTPVGKWDLTDPFRPKAPELAYIAHSEPPSNGPLVYWWHAQVYGGATVAENENGDAVMLDAYGGRMFGPGQCLTTVTDPKTGYPVVVPNVGPCRLIPTGVAAMSFPAGAAPRFGQSIALEDAVPGHGMDSYAAGERIFAYAPYGQAVKVFELTPHRLSGNAAEPYLNADASIGWSQALKVHVTRFAGRERQFLVAKTASGHRIGAINPSSGRLESERPLSIKSGSGATILSAAFEGDLYLLVADPPAGYPTNAAEPTTIAAYRLDPASLEVERVGSLTVTVLTTNGDLAGNASVLSGSTDATAPLLAVSKVQRLFMGDANNGIDLYSLKALLTQGGDSSPAPSFTLPTLALPEVLRVGDVALAPYPFPGFLRTEGGSTFLYIYRNAFQWQGQFDYDSMFKAVSSDYGTDRRDGSLPLTGYGLADVYGSPSVRVDRIDVTSLTGLEVASDGGGSQGEGSGAGGGSGETGTGGGAGGGSDPATISGHETARAARAGLPELRSGGIVSGSAGIASGRPAGRADAASAGASPAGRRDGARAQASGRAAASAAPDGDSLSGCAATAALPRDVYGRGVANASQLPRVALPLVREYQGLSSALDGEPRFEALADCLPRGARLAYAMNARLTELADACGEPAWKAPGLALTWEGLEAAGQALCRCGAGAPFGDCRSCKAACPARLAAR